MLDVHCRKNIDVGVEKRDDIFISFRVEAALYICVGELIHQHNCGASRQDRGQVHLSERDPFIFDHLPWDLLQLRSQFSRSRAPVSFYDPNYDVLTAFTTSYGLRQHVERLSNAWSIAKEKLERSSGLQQRIYLVKPFLRSSRGCPVVDGRGI